jgi:hypothetical protein
MEWTEKSQDESDGEGDDFETHDRQWIAGKYQQIHKENAGVDGCSVTLLEALQRVVLMEPVLSSTKKT